ncbi:MAG: LLM class flavin-dependent oxidoreductase [Gordonia sp. (in: high G+C Gram-positive bacteria)]
MGPNVTHVFLREPTLIAQAIATLDELTGGRAEMVVSTGNYVMMEQYGMGDWSRRKPLSRLKEALHVMRTFLDEGKIEFEGEFFNYSGLWTNARPVQKPLPFRMGCMKGPKSFEAAGEYADGMHLAIAYSREAWEYAAKHTKIGVDKAGKDWGTYDFGAWVTTVVSEDSAAAKEAARILAAFYIPSMPRDLIARHGLDPDDLQPIFNAFAAGDLEKVMELTTPELGDLLSVSGTPEEVVDKIKSDIAPAGVNHMVLAISDPTIVRVFSGRDVDVPSVQEQLRLVADRVMPAFE